VLGPEGGDVAEHVRRSTFCWWLHEQFDAISRGTAPIASVATSADRESTPHLPDRGPWLARVAGRHPETDGRGGRTARERPPQRARRADDRARLPLRGPAALPGRRAACHGRDPPALADALPQLDGDHGAVPASEVGEAARPDRAHDGWALPTHHLWRGVGKAAPVGAPGCSDDGVGSGGCREDRRPDLQQGNLHGREEGLAHVRATPPRLRRG
jgi:hypothetical protein